jgi:radical SAM-linked protein
LITVRIKFVRGEEVKYISHLDLMKTFERAIRRSGIPIAYSQGFNPHPHMVFGLPLSVGVTSEAEYGDFELSAPMSPEQLKKDLNDSLPKGLRVLNARDKHVKDNIMASIGVARYMLLLTTEHKNDIKTLNSKIEEFMNKSQIIVKKESKKGPRDVDIRPMIHSIQVVELNGTAESNTCESEADCVNTAAWLNGYIKGLTEGYSKPSFSVDNIFCLSVLVSAGSTSNLKPELLISALEEFFSDALRTVKIHRTELFVDTKDGIVDPLDERVLG